MNLPQIPISAKLEKGVMLSYEEKKNYQDEKRGEEDLLQSSKEQADSNMQCVRCNREVKTDRHHKIPKIDGGVDTPANLEYRCKPCHSFRHTELRILKDIARSRVRILQLKHRLKVLREFNTPELIRERGTYKPYWEDETTHYQRR